jgi:hypothetical protein
VTPKLTSMPSRFFSIRITSPEIAARNSVRNVLSDSASGPVAAVWLRAYDQELRQHLVLSAGIEQPFEQAERGAKKCFASRLLFTSCSFDPA